MKKPVFLSIMMLTGMFAFANNGNGDTNNSEPKQVNDQTVITETKEEKAEEGLYCHVKIGDNEATCWFCDCEKLTKALKEEIKKNN